tara:strand:- start:1 stop:288 length:288 start_codon:yes stop_codon:yes gene_type:complete
MYEASFKIKYHQILNTKYEIFLYSYIRINYINMNIVLEKVIREIRHVEHVKDIECNIKDNEKDEQMIDTVKDVLKTIRKNNSTENFIKFQLGWIL